MKGVSKGHIAILIVNIIFGLNIPIAKSVLIDAGVDSLALTYFRMFGATLVFWIASLFIKTIKLTKKDFLILFLASLFGVGINQTTFIVGLKTTSPIDASLIVTLTPIITMLISALYLKEPITAKKVIGVFVGCIGAVTLILSSNHFNFSDTRSWWGNVLCLVSSTSYACYLVFFRDFIKRNHPITIMKWMFLFSTIIITPICFSKVQAVDYANLDLQVYLKIAYVVLMATFLTYLLIPMGQKNLRPTTLTMYNYLQPLIAACVAVVFGQDIFGWDKALSAVLVFLGVYIVTQSKSRQQIELEKQNKQNAVFK